MNLVSSKSLKKQQTINHSHIHPNLRMSKQLAMEKNPQEHSEQFIKSMVKSYLKDKNLDQMKSKFYNERILKRRNRINSQLRKSIRKDKTEADCKTYREEYSQDKRSLTIEVDDHKAHCQMCRQCTCKVHHCEINKVKFKPRDPMSKFYSNYTRDTRQIRSNLHLNRPQITASYYSAQLENLPQYSPKFQAMNLDSSYQVSYNQNNIKSDKKNMQNNESFKHLKLSHFRLGARDLKNFQSSYQHQYNIEKNKEKNLIKSPEPFVVKQPENLNAFGLKYNSINSNYCKQFSSKKVLKRQPLKPPSLLKNTDIQLIKQSKYQQINSARNEAVKTSRRARSNNEKIPIIHHLSSSFIPLDSLTPRGELFDSLYRKDYIKERTNEDVKKYACPQGIKSSHGAISKFP